MIWFMPRANPGALSEYLRPNRCGVSAPAGKLPHGPLPRLLMLWMYAELGRARHTAPLDLVYSLSDYLLALEVPDTLDLVEQAERLFACRFHAGEHEMALTEASTTRWVAQHDPLGEIAPLRATRVELGQAMRDELARRRLRVCAHSLYALRERPFALDVYLWETCYRDVEIPGITSARSRLALYHTLAERPVPRPTPDEVHAFEREFHDARDRLARLREEAGPAEQGDDCSY